MSDPNYYNSLYGLPEPADTVAEDAALSGLKGGLDQTFPKRIRIRRDLISYIPPSQATNIIYKNVSLIKTIPASEHERITRYIKGVFTGRYEREKLISYLMRIGDVTEARATLIADDQIAKASEQFKVAKWLARGVTRVRWVHSGAEEPRDYHLRRWNRSSGTRNGKPNGLNGFEFDLRNPPVIDLKTGERGFPGQLVNCHCHLEIVR